MKRRPRSTASVLARRLDELGKVSETAHGLTRTYLSPAMDEANALVGGWMREAGLVVREDDAGNLMGRWAAEKSGAKTLLLGSHLDTVRDAGRFDGALGVVLPIVAIAELRARGVTLPFSVEVIGFSEEEAVRFASAYIGSKAYTGRLSEKELQSKDAQGRTLREVIEQHAGRPFRRPAGAYRANNLIGYVEVHIEQGPVLEAGNLALGVVSAVASQTRGELIFRGQAGHAGTTPMPLRRDALTRATKFILMAEKFARERSPLVATVGTLQVPAGATNVIPGQTVLSLDVRHPSDRSCRRAVSQLVKSAQRIARRRGLSCEWRETMRHAATSCSRRLTSVLERSVCAQQGRSVMLSSGAGHDSVVMAKLTPVAMLFVRCRDGLSHHPDEYVSPKDLAMALRTMIDFIERLAARENKS
jgi:allantoate deiminase